MSDLCCFLCRAKLDKLPSPTQPSPDSHVTMSGDSHVTKSGDSHVTKSGDTHVTKSGDVCRLQVRLPSGSVLRRNFPSTTPLCEVVDFVKEGGSGECDSVRLVQVGVVSGCGLTHSPYSHDQRCLDY